MSRKTVVVVGSGLFGISVANQLAKSSILKVVLISPSETGYIIPASVRIPVFNENKGAIFPLSEAVVDKVEIVVGKAEFFDQKKVSVQGQAIPFDFLVVATGSKWSAPIGSTAEFGDDHDSYFEEQHDKIESAKHIVLVGGGFNNTELAGELLDKYEDQLKKGTKKITIVQSLPQLLPNNGFYSDSLRSRVTKFLNDSPIDLKLNTRGTVTKSNQVTLSTGEVIQADYIVTSIGIRPAVPENNVTGLCDVDGFIKVDDTFQTSAAPNIFSIGDVNSFKFKGLILRDKWIPVIVNNIVKLANGDKTPLIRAQHQKGNITTAVSLGRNHGFGQFNTGIFGVWQLPQFVCVSRKSTNLFLDIPKKKIFMQQ